MDKVILDKKGRALHNKGSGLNQSDLGPKNAMRRSQSKAEGISDSGKRFSPSGWCPFTHSGLIKHLQQSYNVSKS